MFRIFMISAALAMSINTASAASAPDAQAVNVCLLVGEAAEIVMHQRQFSDDMPQALQAAAKLAMDNPSEFETLYKRMYFEMIDEAYKMFQANTSEGKWEAIKLFKTAKLSVCMRGMMKEGA